MALLCMGVSLVKPWSLSPSWVFRERGSSPKAWPVRTGPVANDTTPSCVVPYSNRPYLNALAAAGLLLHLPTLSSSQTAPHFPPTDKASKETAQVGLTSRGHSMISLFSRSAISASSRCRRPILRSPRW